MAFEVEDGSGLPGANSYQSLDDLKAFHLDRGVDLVAVPYTDTEIQASAIRATDYMDKRFGRRFRGWRRKRSQGLEWPRTDAVDDDGFLFDDLPPALLKAHAEYMLLDLQLSTLTPLPNVPFPTVDPDTGTVTTGATTLVKSRDKVGPIEEERGYSGTTGTNRPMTSSGNLIQNVREYPVADLWVEEIIESASSREILRG